jgi:N-acetylmuramoyl-L-alanine amidase
MKVFLSHSSQDGNRGAVSGYIESDVNRKINDVTERELKRHGVEVMRNVPGDTFQQRTDRSNSWGADIHSCSHTNAFDGRTGGTTYVGCYNASDIARRSTQNANLAAYECRKAWPERKVNVVTYAFHEVTKTKSPCLYFEWAFHDEINDCKWILAHIEEIGIVQAKGILASLGIAWNNPSPVPAPTPAPTPAPAPVPTGISVGGTYRIVTSGYSGSDGTGKEVQVASISAKCIKINAGAKYPYGMDYVGNGFVSAWFPENCIKI